MSKVSIRFFDDREVRAIWDDASSKWYFSVLDIIGVLNAYALFESSFINSIEVGTVKGIDYSYYYEEA